MFQTFRTKIQWEQALSLYLKIFCYARPVQNINIPHIALQAFKRMHSKYNYENAEFHFERRTFVLLYKSVLVEYVFVNNILNIYLALF